MTGEGDTTSRRLRFLWLDALRGVALIAMASYHFMWDLADFGYLAPDFPSTGWPRLYARGIASTFLFLAGFSLVLAHGNGIRWKSFGIRFARIAAAAALVSVATWFIIPQGFIFFGILHAIAAASLIGLAFLRVPSPLTVLVAVLVIAAPIYLRADAFNSPWLWWVGLSTQTHVSFDYVPLLPWLAPFLLGVVAARLGVVRNWLRQNAQGKTPPPLWKALPGFLGRHSLVFYLVHQPVLISILYLYSLAAPPPPVDQGAEFSRSCVAGCIPDRDADFCRRFCGCALTSLQQENLLSSLKADAISQRDNDRIDEIRVQCTTTSQ